jgi:hypothetical protein
MIAKISGYQGKPEYIALHWNPVLELWMPVRGDRGVFGELSEMTAATLCIGDLQSQLEPVIASASELHKLYDRRKRPDGAALAQQCSTLSREVSEALDVVGVNLAYLLKAPTPLDKVRIDAEFERGEPMTADRVFLRCISAAMEYARVTTGKGVTRDGIADARDFLDDLLANFHKLAQGNGYAPGGDDNNGGDDQ